MAKKSKQITACAKSIKNWPEDDRPREKLFKSGEHTLSNTELLAILLRSGVKGQSAIDLSRKILSKFKTLRNMSHTDIRDWKEFKGLGQAKIAQIRAAMELGRRFSTENTQPKGKVKSSKDIADLFMGRMRDLKKEVFKILLLDNRNQIIETIELAEGTVNQANPIVREIMSKALQNFASALACVHNHPTGDCTPSKEDREFTRGLCQASNIMQMKVVDHIIIGDNTYFSFVDRGQLPI
ncbi:MAG: DNA repair protein RadC [Candidatus Omnitrophota bacterium]|nr:MAG: DNA repair protein RadC [Candidatus Omnitrophota bacterium]